MATLLFKIGRSSYRRWPIVIALWIIGLVGLSMISSNFSKPMSDEFTMPGIESVETADLQSELFPAAKDVGSPSATIAIQAPQGHTLTEADYSAAIAHWSRISQASTACRP